MTRIFALAILGLFAAAGLALGDEYDAVINKPPKQAADGSQTLTLEKVQLDSKGRVVGRVIVTGALTKETKVAMGKYNEKAKKWEAGEPIEKGLYGDVFKDLGKQGVLVHFIPREDNQGMSEILVRKVGVSLKK